MSSATGRPAGAPRPTGSPPVHTDCLTGSGEASELARAVDWSRTAIGPVAGWSQALRATAALVLHNHCGMLLWWGPEFVQIYNDACRPMLGEEHPRAMGRRLRDCWTEVLPILGPLVERAYRGGPACGSDGIGMPVHCELPGEKTQFRLICSPVPDATVATGIGGVLAIVTAISGHVCAEPRTAAVREPGPGSAQDADGNALEWFRAESQVRQGNGTEQALGEREEQLRLATEAAEVGLWDLDMTTDTLFWPSRVKAMFGISADAPVSMADFYSGLHPDDRQRTSEAFAAALDPRRRALYDVEYRTVGKEDGRIRWVAAKGRGIFDADGRCVRVIGTAIDITARRGQEERLREETRVQELLGKVSQALVAAQLDTDRVVQVVTDAATELSGAAFGAFFYNVENEQGESYLLYTLSGAPREAFAGFPNPRNTAIFSPTFRGEGVMRSADITADERYGHNAPYVGMPKGHLPVRSYLAVPVKAPSGSVLGGLFFGHPDPDVFDEQTERRVVALAAQAAVAFENARLHQASRWEIEKRRRVEEALSEADRRKDEFLAMLAHELRNPLAPIGTASELLSRTVTGDARARTAIGMIKRQAAHLTRLVDDLLDVSRITQGRIQLRRKPVDLAGVVTQALETVEPQLRERQQRLAVTALSYEPLYVSGDFARLVQCVGNILTNAVKYTEAGGEISIHTGGDRHTVFIRVADNGSGIAPELLPKVFELFVQGERTLDRAQGGLGIGLALVRRLVEMHGGQVRAHSEGLGRGSTFEIELPRIARPEAAAADLAAVNTAPRRILIVDDNADAANSLALLLGLRGHETRVACSARETLAAVESFRPDVGLLDIGLPEMNGYELARRLRALPRTSRLRLVALTGYGQAEDQQRALAAGFDAHLIKPVELAALERALADPGADGLRDG
jgi:PAS domain S-box-containing protein